ncbi:hypothetical protein K525DRAFT_363888 [Schizophyllum commune Loenen D]|nr:hypothetical protein K525DRAFT_363888 [Schizophyllum commune Loenen D]
MEKGLGRRTIFSCTESSSPPSVLDIKGDWDSSGDAGAAGIGVSRGGGVISGGVAIDCERAEDDCEAWWSLSSSSSKERCRDMGCGGSERIMRPGSCKPPSAKGDIGPARDDGRASGVMARDCACKTRGRVTVPPPIAGTVSYSIGTAVGRSSRGSPQSTTSNGSETRSSTSSYCESRSAAVDDESSVSSARSASPRVGVENKLLKEWKLLFCGTPSGRRPYVGSYAKSSGSESSAACEGVVGGFAKGEVAGLERVERTEGL